MLDSNKIYNEDCLTGMKRMDDGSVDIIINDLPYGILNKGNAASLWDRRIPLDALWREYMRIKKPDTPVILFGQGMFTAEVMLSCRSLWRYNLIWVKDRPSGHLNANRMPLRQHEDLIVFYEKPPVYHPQMRKCLPSERTHGRKAQVFKTNRCYGAMKAVPPRIMDEKYPTSIICIPKEYRKGEFFHPTQKPVALMEYLIMTYSDEGDLVLDSCMGSGTTAVAAIRCGRDFIGFETDETFCNTARGRIDDEIKSINQ